MIIDKGIADSLHLEKVTRGTGVGVGGSVTSYGRLVKEFKIGPATVRNLNFGDFDMSQIAGKAKPTIAGAIGTPLLRRMILEMDWKVPSVKAYDRASYRLRGGDWQPIRFDSENPAILAQAAGTSKAWYRVDSGAGNFLTLHSPFVQRWSLLNGRQTTSSISTGIGGSQGSRSGTLDWFEVAGHRFSNPPVEFSVATQGTFANPYLAGNIGLGVLRNFRVVLDFSGHRLALLPH